MGPIFNRVLRANSRCSQYLGSGGVKFLCHAAGAITRILPHTQVSAWTEVAWERPYARWTSSDRRGIRVSIPIGDREARVARSVSSEVTRRRVPSGVGSIGRTLDLREQDICRRVAERVSSVLGGTNAAPASVSLSALRAAFDEQVVAAHIKAHHGLDINIADVLGSIHELAEQTYENKSLAFGCLIDPNWVVDGEAVFPSTMLESKKYRALSDGFKTAYHVATGGHLLGFVDLENFDRRKLGARHYFPEWCEDIAKASRGGRCGISLTRNGEILVFDEGSLRFSYRFGRWQYWNHSHLVDLLRNLTRVQRVPTERVSTVAAAVYRVALDVSFRRTGALFVILRNERNLRKVVRRGDAINDRRRETIDKQFDDALPAGTIQSLPRGVIAEIAALDGAIVMNNRGQILAYGAVLNPQKKGRISRAEGSRTKAAIGASHYGLAVKVSADGDITVYHQGNRFISV